uniref:F-box only protein 6 n=1 Tax=Ascaris suum TaxID=6253 RepID=F1KZN4_ASCSU
MASREKLRKPRFRRFPVTIPHHPETSMPNPLNVVIDKAASFLGLATYASGPGGENEDIMVNGEPIAPQILAEVFLRIDNSVTVGYICPLVCRRWHNVLSAAGFWIDYMRRRSRIIPPPALRSEQLLNMKKVCLKQPFERNLIGNPSGEKNFDGWTIRENGGNRIIIENPPLGCATKLDDDIAVCFATSFGWGKMCYVVDLWKEGIEPAFLDAYRPPITVSEYFTCRTDCAATYVLDVELVPDGQETCISTERPVMTRRDRFGRPVMVRRQRPEGDATTNFSITRVRNMEQWSSKFHSSPLQFESETDCSDRSLMVIEILSHQSSRRSVFLSFVMSLTFGRVS